jgi:hypothetical protein
MPIDDVKLYDEAGQAWRHFASWREKTFAGYLTALAALAIGFTHHPGAPLRTIICAGSILVSVVFWILENRSRELINACQLAADRLEQARGCYAELNRVGFERNSRLTYGFAVGLLVGGVGATSVAGLWIYGISWWRGDPSAWPMGAAIAGAVLFVLLPRLFKLIAERERSASTAEYRAANFYDLDALQTARRARGATGQ